MKIVRFSAVAAATMILAACGGTTDTDETADETNVEGAADETVGAAEAEGDALNPVEQAGDTAVAVDNAMEQAEAAADETAAEAQEATN